MENANAKPPILIISGTSRPGSNTARIAEVVKRHYEAIGAPAEVYGLTEMPIEAFAPEAYATKPPAFVQTQARVLAAAGLHIVTPEYNGSFPGVLKHFIDLLKFPESFDRKPVAFVGVAAGIWGALRSVEQLQLVFGYRNAHVYPDRVFIPGVAGKLAADGALSDPALNDRLAKQARGFAEYACVFAPKASA